MFWRFLRSIRNFMSSVFLSWFNRTQTNNQPNISAATPTTTTTSSSSSTTFIQQTTNIHSIRSGIIAPASSASTTPRKRSAWHQLVAVKEKPFYVEPKTLYFYPTKDHHFELIGKVDGKIDKGKDYVNTPVCIKISKSTLSKHLDSVNQFIETNSIKALSNQAKDILFDQAAKKELFFEWPSPEKAVMYILQQIRPLLPLPHDRNPKSEDWLLHVFIDAGFKLGSTKEADIIARDCFKPKKLLEKDEPDNTPWRDNCIMQLKNYFIGDKKVTLLIKQLEICCNNLTMESFPKLVLPTKTNQQSLRLAM